MSNQPARVPQCCGVCRWWKELSRGEFLGRCHAPIPKSIKHARQQFMYHEEGTDCPCFERKEGE